MYKTAYDCVRFEWFRYLVSKRKKSPRVGQITTHILTMKKNWPSSLQVKYNIVKDK